MEKKILDIIYNLNYKVFMKNNILLESNPDFSDNTKAVYDELVKRKFNEKYKIIWFVENPSKFNDIKEKNVKFVKRNKRILNLIRFIYYNLFSKYIIDCNKYIKKRNKYQFRIHLTHGTPLKLVREYCKQLGEVDYLIQISDYFTDINCKVFHIEKEKIISTGFPRNDIILNSSDGLKAFNEIDRKKTICWLPTYRNHKAIKNNSIYNMNMNFPFGIPVINNANELQRLNKALLENNVLLLIKLHPAEDSSKIQKFDFTNIKLIEDNFFESGHKNLYQLLASVDALITDYSSVYYDFLITDKPIGLAMPDIDEYAKHVELLFKDDIKENIPGEYIDNIEDLIYFVKNVSTESDISLKERKEKKKLYYKYCDNQSSKRVVDVLEQNLF